MQLRLPVASVPSLALLIAGHRCGGPGSPALGAVGTGTALQGGGLSQGPA
jgi:hypothetical protein